MGNCQGGPDSVGPRRQTTPAPPPPPSPCQELLEAPVRKIYPADAHTSTHQSVLQSANPAWTWSVHLDAPGERHGQQPVSGTADPGVVKQDKSARGSVDTTRTRSDPQRVRMSSGERPILGVHCVQRQSRKRGARNTKNAEDQTG